MTTVETVADLRQRACARSASLWEAFDLPDDMLLDELWAEWTPQAAIELARLDGRGPGLGAVAWLDRALGTAVLCGANLVSVDFSAAYLPNVDLSYANLRGAHLVRANLRGARLDGADLRGADLRGADLRKARLDGVDLRGAVLDGARLDDADMTSAIR